MHICKYCIVFLGQEKIHFYIASNFIDHITYCFWCDDVLLLNDAKMLIHFFCIISIFKNLDNIVVQCHLLWWIFQFLNLTLMHYRSAFSKIHKTSILVWLKIGPKERICPLFLDKKISPKNGLYFWKSYTQGSPVEFNLDFLGIF